MMAVDSGGVFLPEPSGTGVRLSTMLRRSPQKNKIKTVMVIYPRELECDNDILYRICNRRTVILNFVVGRKIL
jgi:hypothetical protein